MITVGVNERFDVDTFGVLKVQSFEVTNHTSMFRDDATCPSGCSIG